MFQHLGTKQMWMTSSTFLVALLLLSASEAGAQQRERRNIEDLLENHPQELETYKYAIELLMKKADMNSNYRYFANLHNVHTSNCGHGCEHWNDLFLPFHRSLLYEFEQALQATDPPRTKDVTIPYWDWTRPHSGVRYPKAFEERGSVLCDRVVIDVPGWNNFHNRRNRGASTPPFIPTQMDDLIKLPYWRDFGGGPKPPQDPCFRNGGGDLEHPFHDDVHGFYIGGDMQRTDRAARDPIFWSFHCYVDLLWDRWQQAHPEERPTSLDATLRGLTVKNTVRQVEKTKDLGYFYQHRPEDLKVIQVKAIPIKDLRYRVVPTASAMGVADKVVARWGGEGPFTFKFKIPEQGFETAHLKLADVKVPSSVSYRAHVYVYPASVPYAPQQGEFRTKYRFPLPFSMWQGHTHGEQHHPETRDFYLRITPLLQQLAKDNAGKEWVVTLAIQPSEPAPDPAAPPVKASPLRGEVQFSTMTIVLDRAGILPPAPKLDKEGHKEP